MSGLFIILLVVIVAMSAFWWACDWLFRRPYQTEYERRKEVWKKDRTDA